MSFYNILARFVRTTISHKDLVEDSSGETPCQSLCGKDSVEVSRAFAQADAKRKKLANRILEIHLPELVLNAAFNGVSTLSRPRWLR